MGRDFYDSSTDKPMRRFRLILEYDGTDYAGFQLQGKGERTIQGSLEEAIERLSGAFSRTHGAGRTDAGVHASGQVVHFDTEWPIPAENVASALNGALPRDIAVKAVRETNLSFHARYSALNRTYRYVILNRSVPSALLGRFALHIRNPLDLSAMRAVANELIGTHDFAAFGQPDTPGKSTVRRIESVAVRPYRDCVLITVCGNAFLRSMVRSFVGVLIPAGAGKLGPADVRRIRESGDRAQCPSIAPAHGLCLVRVKYGEGRSQGFEGDSVTDYAES